MRCGQPQKDRTRDNKVKYLSVEPKLNHVYKVDVDCSKKTNVDDANVLNNSNFTPTFSADYSIKGTAKCQKCKGKIPKDELRIGKTKMFRKKMIVEFYHVSCAFNMFQSVRTLQNVICNESEIHGFENLLENDKSALREKLRSIEPIIEKLKNVCPDPAPKKKKVENQPNAPKRYKTIQSFGESSIKVLYSNADQLTVEKLNELLCKVKLHKPHLVAICEVKSKRKSLNTPDHYKIPGYSLRHVNLNNDIGRGIAVFSKLELDSSISQIDCNFQEGLTLEIKLRGHDCLSFTCVYRSPTKSDTSAENCIKLNNMLINIAKDKKYTHRCIIGDFNYKDINWELMATLKGEGSDEEKFLRAIQDSYLHQNILEPTRKRGDDEPSILDLIITDEETQLSEVKFDSPLGKSDHSTLIFDFNCYVEKAIKSERYNYEAGDYEAMINDIEQSKWNHKFIDLSKSCTNVNELWLEFKTKIESLRKKFIPKINVSNKPHWTDKGSVPLDKKTLKLLKEKDKLHRKWIKAINNEENYARRLEYTKARNKAKSSIRSAKRAFEKEIACKAKRNPKPFWAYTRRKIKTSTGVSALLSDVNDPMSIKFSAGDKAEILQKQFLSVFTTEPDGPLPIVPQASNLISDLVVTEKVVEELLSKINPNKSVGPDDLHPKLLKELSKCLISPITVLFNFTLKYGIPEDWKVGHISPIFKKGSKKNAENYRPISLTSVLCKIMEKIVRSHLMTHLRENKLLSSKQFGFISGRSTTTQLLYFIDKCINIITEGKVVDVIYFDFAKAFDCVPHKRLLQKLTSFGISGNTFNWIKSFLLQRKQYVSVNGVKSKTENVLSGVPQGTVLGPILFVMYINDLLDGIVADGLLYADDTKLFKHIMNENDALCLQTDIEKLENWAKLWLMNFHPGKCHTLTIGKFENIRHAHQYKVCNQNIEHIDVEKDIGVQIDEELSFEQHICTKVRVANAIMGHIRRAFTFLDLVTFKKLYTSMVRPHLEYGQCIWSPFLMKYINMIERVQERATKLVDGLSNEDYSTRLKKLGLTTLRFRRIRGDLIEMWKHFNTYDIEAVTAPSFKRRERPSRQHKHQVVDQPRLRERGLRENSFYGRVARLWNSLPKEVAEADNINLFKNKLDRHLDNHPLKYNRITIEDEQ